MAMVIAVSRRGSGWRVARGARVPVRIAALTLSLFFAFPAVAAATNYYGIGYLYGSYFRGTELNLRSDALAVANVGTEVVGNLDWVINTNASPLQWIEAGLVDGNATYGNCNAIVSPHSFFWADQRPNGSYNCHVGQVFSQGVYYGTTIYQLAAYGTTWDVGVGTLAQQSTNSLVTANLIETGTEEDTQPDGLSCSSSSNMQWYDSNGHLHTGWSDSSNGQAQLSASNPPGVYWVSQPNWLRSYAPNKSTCGF